MHTQALENSPVPHTSTAEDTTARLLNKDQLAAKLGITRRGIECLMARRKIPVIRLGHRSVRFSWPKVMAALEKLESKAI